MSAPDPDDLLPVVEEFRGALEECEAIYCDAAEECTRSHQELYGEPEEDFQERMLDLAHGLGLKVFLGLTAPKAHKKIDEALGGVLFIDEAYSLVAEKGDDPYGNEALQVLLKRMEDDRGRLVVVLAGYPRPLDRLLRSNPGLSSRFNRTFAFPGYSAAELGRIFESLCRQNRYELPPATRAKLLLGFDYLLKHRDEHFGNGRLVRNVFEQAIAHLANRITGVLPLTRELLTTLRPEDIVMDKVPEEVWQGLEAGAHAFRVECPGCHTGCRAPQ